MSSWVYHKVKNNYPKNIISKIISKEIYNGLNKYKNNIYINNYNHKGCKQSIITIVEYGDLECVYCKKVSKLLSLLLKKYPLKIKIIYKHFPISIHKNAKVLSLISESFKNTNIFWIFHNFLEKQTSYNVDTVQFFLRNNNIDLMETRIETFNKKTYCKILNSIKEARMIMLSGVPAVFFNKKRYNLTHDFYSLEIRLKIEISKKIML